MINGPLELDIALKSSKRYEQQPGDLYQYCEGLPIIGGEVVVRW